MSTTVNAQPAGGTRANDGNRWSIRWRLALAFVLVAAVSVGLVATLAVILGERDLSTLAEQRRDDLTRSLVADAASGYNTGTPGWSDADLQPALVLAEHNGAEIAVVDAHNRLVVSSRVGVDQASDAKRHPIQVRDQTVGTLVIRFNSRGIDASARHLQTTLLFAVLAAAGVACLLALAVAAVASRRLTRPLSRLISTVRAIGAGDRHARVGSVDAPGEIRELTTSFDAMADDLVRQEKLRRNLIADLAHELRTPVAVLQAGCEALLDGVTSPTPDELTSLHEEVIRLARLVDDFQVLAAADAAALHLATRVVDLAELTETATDALARRFETARITLRRKLQPASVIGDPDRLRQVLLNLLTNAVKFTPAGGRVDVSVQPEEESVVLSVSDTGIGIDEASLQQVFDRFWRGPNAGGVSGTGIGLSIVDGLVRAHHGTVSVSSTPGAGTTFTVRFPSASA
ncbi:MAG TPA: ATP-binding protein [Mycobacteriales bacterium]|nr:ATP-binding protein [Mycobacteriales bacterium]